MDAPAHGESARILPGCLRHKALEGPIWAECSIDSLGWEKEFSFGMKEHGMLERVSLSGEWIGHYPGHFDEVIRIDQRGDKIEAVKITGDDYVPAGATTWRASLETLRGEGQIAEEEFTRPRFIPGRLIIVSQERIIFRWENCGEVEFRRDD